MIPTALSGIVTGIMLALARVMGETAPLLILVGYAQAINFDMFSGFMGSLPGMMYDQTSAGAGANPVPTDRLWGAALTLIVLIALLNVGARFIAKFFCPQEGLSESRSHDGQASRSQGRQHLLRRRSTPSPTCRCRSRRAA